MGREGKKGIRDGRRCGLLSFYPLSFFIYKSIFFSPPYLRIPAELAGLSFIKKHDPIPYSRSLSSSPCVSRYSFLNLPIPYYSLSLSSSQLSPPPCLLAHLRFGAIVLLFLIFLIYIKYK
ncbi:hypothetical protein G7K_6864-t1 [Saitoella complicata NRRL Y-17804]|uniref:Uncharacterized protein n=1 Tax=Saitoella complicata (strain BCRC 22490 / CBS 7301 / JCM 7358 / NBRC 10748 / NRRL Y-17804) TaxID=698492 RepID=A0A0E9NSC5_SAICN|nr:hypothetical protein G7K_6864-t1 [Saitoella complicata NRRL Y-17804]